MFKRGLLGQRQCSQYARLIPQGGWHDVGVDILQDNRGLDVPVEQGLYLAPNKREEVALVHHAAAQDDALRREDAYEADAGQRQVMRFQLPGWMIVGQATGGYSPARL